MRKTITGFLGGPGSWSYRILMILGMILLAVVVLSWNDSVTVRAQEGAGTVLFENGVDPEQWYQDHEIENSWVPDYLDLATGDPELATDHGVYAWPFVLDSIGWSMQSYQDYGGTPYFHHGMDMMKVHGTWVYNRSGGQVVNIENYQLGNPLYWEVAVLDPDGYIWQYHHIEEGTIPQYIQDKYNEYLADPVNGGFIPADTHIGNIIYWPVEDFHHIHLNILASGGIYVNGFEFHDPLPDEDFPEIQGIGLLQNGLVYQGNSIEGNYSLYVHTRDLILDHIHGYYLPPWEITFSVDGGAVQTTWRFDTLPGGASRYAYLDDFYVVPPTCGDYYCRDYYIDLGFIPDSQFIFPDTSGEHTIQVTVRDYAGNLATQSFTYTIIGPPPGTPVWQDDFETDLGWVVDPNGTDTATSGQWERADPQDTFSNGPKQLGTTPSGNNDLVTGHLAGAGATTYDIDGGTTSIRSPDIPLPDNVELTLSLRYYLAHGSNSSSLDYLRVSMVGASTSIVFEELGAANDDDGVWDINNTDITSFSGETVYILITAADESGESLVEAAIDNVIIVSNEVNQAPIANPQSISTPEDNSLDILLSGSDPDGNPFFFTLVSTPTHGTLSGLAPNLVYQPVENFNGSDSFSFTVNDGQLPSNPAIVSIEVSPVNDPPEALPQQLTVLQGFPVDITLAGYDLDGDELAFTVISPPANGVLSGTGPMLMYTPQPGFIGSDSFTFDVGDGLLNSPQAEVVIMIHAAMYIPLVTR